MIPELGNLALMLALVVALTQGVLALVGAQRNNTALMGLGRSGAQAQWLLIAFAFGTLAYSFLTKDFSVLYVAEHSNADLPAVYRFAAVWGGHEGSLLLWMFMLSSWMLAVSLLSRSLPETMVARVLGVLGLVSFGFLVYMVFTSSPFVRLLPAPENGQDLNPLLQDPGLVAHPPMLYMGYVGFSVAFAFAMAALISGKLDAAWARWSRPWTIAAWVFLTLGIALGSGWSYYTLGWGGWWFWDPVENASFMPWLVGTALMHSLAVTEKRGAFKNWTVLLAIGAFSLSLLGTFLVRSGVLTSVHAFAVAPRRGLFILIFLSIVIGASLLMFAWRAPKVGLGGRFSLMSRETLLLLNNVLLVVACGVVLLGTLYPLIIQALGLGKISVGPPYFDSVFVPIMLPLLFVLGLGPMSRWKTASLGDLTRRLRWALVLAVIGGIVLPWGLGSWTPLIGLGILLALWIMAATATDIKHRLRSGSRPPRAFWGMHLAHLGIAVFVVGATLVKGYQTEKEVRMAPGDTVAIGGYTLRLLAIKNAMGPNYSAKVGEFQLLKDGHVVRMLRPQKRTFFSSQMPITDAAIDTGFTRDIYVSLGESLGKNGGSGAWSVRVHYKPFVDWIWGGCFLMALGGAFAASDRRYRIKARVAVPKAVATGKPSPGVTA